MENPIVPAEQLRIQIVRLIGQYDSPFVRRVAVAMHLLGMSYQHLAWSVFADGDRIARHNPLRRVPVLVLDDGDSLIESGAIIEHLEAMERGSLWPETPQERRAAVRITCLATGAADKAVSLVYEKRLHEKASPVWLERCSTQLSAALDELEAPRTRAASPYFFGERIGHADIALACMWRFLREAHPDDFDFAQWRALVRHSSRCESLPAFEAVVQPFSVGV